MNSQSVSGFPPGVMGGWRNRSRGAASRNGSGKSHPFYRHCVQIRGAVAGVRQWRGWTGAVAEGAADAVAAGAAATAAAKRSQPEIFASADN